MPRSAKPGRRRALALRIGAIVTKGRLDLGLTKAALAGRSGISRQKVGAVEAGIANPTLEVVASLFHGLSLDVVITARGAGALDGGRRHDAAHARCSAYVQRRLEASGWLVAREVAVGSGRYIGWIDLLALHESTGTLLVIEIKTRLDDLGAIERSMDWYRSGAMTAARRLGWRPRRLATWLLALMTDEVEASVSAARRPLATSFPGRAFGMRTLVLDPRRGPLEAGLALIDPRSRRRDWLIRCRVDGRRSPAPYRGYADFIAATQGRRSRSPGRRRGRPSPLAVRAPARRDALPG